MKNHSFLFILIFCVNALTALSQDNFEKGFVIDLQGDTIHGFINNTDRVQNPEAILFKRDNDSITTTYLPGNIKKFMVGRDLYLSAKIVTAGDGIPTIENQSKSPSWVFLLAIAEGSRSIYYFADKSLSGQFFIKEDSVFTLLNYREYAVTDGNGVKTIKKDQRFKGQLILYLQDCPGLREEISSTALNEKDMNKLFLKYYRCKSETAYLRKMKKMRVEFAALGGTSLTNVVFNKVDETQYILPVANADYQTYFQPLFGICTEFILPKNHEKLTLLAEGFYSSIHIKGSYVIQGYNAQNHTDYTVDIAVKQVMLNAALRYRINLGNMRLFFDGGLSYGIAISSETSLNAVQYYYGSIIELPEKEAIGIENTELGFFTGIGLKYSRFSLETRYRLGSGITVSGDQSSTGTKTKQLSFVLGFRI
jgi:hypothetical protein